MTIRNYLNRRIQRSLAVEAEMEALTARMAAVEATNEEQDAALVELAEMIGGESNG